MKTISALITAGAILLASSSIAAAQNCGPYEMLRKTLESPQFNEQLTGIGISKNGKIAVQLWQNPKTGDFSVVTVHTPNRPTAPVIGCLVAGGGQWTDVKSKHFNRKKEEKGA